MHRNHLDEKTRTKHQAANTLKKNNKTKRLQLRRGCGFELGGEGDRRGTCNNRKRIALGEA